jgi:hypothetical protein
MDLSRVQALPHQRISTGAQLVCLSNLENLNALFIQQGISQTERLQRLNEIAIAQMKIQTSDR